MMKRLILSTIIFSPLFMRGGVSLSDIKIERGETTVTVSMTISGDGTRLGSDRELTIVPYITNDRDTLRLSAAVIAGHNRYIQRQRAGYPAAYLVNESQTLSYRATVDWEAWMEVSHLDVLEVPCRCGKNSGEPRLLSGLHQIDYSPKQVFEPALAFSTPLPQGDLEKIRQEKGSAYIDFPVNRTEIYPDYRRNPEELAKIRATIDKVVDDPDTRIVAVEIEGFASPEGSYANNVRLASGRAAQLAEYVRSLYAFPQSQIAISSVPENWQGLREYVETSDMADTPGMLAIINDTLMEPDAREARLKKMYPENYAFMLKNVYPGLRRSDYTVRYVVRSYTSVDEIKQLMESDPTKLSAREIFMAANTYNENSPEYEAALRLAARVAPDDEDANLNMAVLSLREGKIALAEHYLGKAGHGAAATYVRGLAAYDKGDTATALKLIEEAAEAGLPEAIDAREQLNIIQ